MVVLTIKTPLLTQVSFVSLEHVSLEVRNKLKVSV